MNTKNITILGRHNIDLPAHGALTDSIEHAARELGIIVNTRWLTPDQLSDPEIAIGKTGGAIIAPRNPERSRVVVEEMLDGIRYLRENDIPTLAIECGYQHMIIELARNRLNHRDASSSGYDSSTSYPVIASIDEDEPRLQPLRPAPRDFWVVPGTALSACHAGRSDITEAFRGHHLMNPDYISEFEEAGLVFSATGKLREQKFPAAIEDSSCAFHVGVSWLPQFASKPGSAHPVIRRLVELALG